MTQTFYPTFPRWEKNAAMLALHDVASDLGINILSITPFSGIIWKTYAVEVEGSPVALAEYHRCILAANQQNPFFV